MYAHTQFSLRYGTMEEKDLLAAYRNNEYSSAVLTDINNTSAAYYFVKYATKNNLRPVLGIDFRNGVNQQFVGLAKNNNGYEILNTFLSEHLHIDRNFEARAPQLEDTFIIYPFKKFKKTKIDLHANEFIGISPFELKHLPFSAWKNSLDQLVIFHPATFRNKRDFNLHRILRAIDNNTLLSKLPPEEQAEESDRMLPKKELFQYFENHPKIIENTEKLLEACSINFDYPSHNNQKTYTESADKDFALLKQLCQEGLAYRYPTVTPEVEKRIEKELDIIQKKDFVAYFLINWDIVGYAQRQGYCYVGRGSGANSIVAYLLRITNVDPIELDLYFERFINLYRENAPDFDLDFSWADRQDMTRYIFERFEHTALIATYNTFQYKSAIREIAKTFGFPAYEIEQLSKGTYRGRDKLSALVYRYASYIDNLPSHLSVHAGGIVIAERPIHHFSATFMPPKGFATMQISMLEAEDFGLFKFDILSQRGLGKISDSVQLIAKNHPQLPPIDIHDIPKFKEDEGIKKILSQGKAIGCFYVESPAMRMLLKKLNVNTYLGLVAASSIIRPGVASSGMMREYILRFKDPVRRKDAPKILLDLMPETFGVMVYQEDVIKVAHHFAGLTLAESDVLRRGMSGKYRSKEEFERIEKQFFTNCGKKGYPASLTADIWRQIKSFAGYAFSKGHSASYAVESYQSLYIKAHFPLEYMVATLNNGGGYYSREFYIHEARMHGGIIEAPCIQKSNYLCSIQGKTIHLGLGFVSGIDSKLAYRIIKEREESGNYQDLQDFIERIYPGREMLELLIQCGALRSLNGNKKELMWQTYRLLNHVPKPSPQITLFHEKVKKTRLPQLVQLDTEEAFSQLEYLGFPLCSPFELLRNPIQERVFGADLPKFKKQVVTLYGYYVTRKRTRTVKGDLMSFGTFTDRHGSYIDTVHFPPINAKFPFRGKGIYKLVGKVTEEFGFYSLEIITMEKLAWIDDPRYVVSTRVSHLSA